MSKIADSGDKYKDDTTSANTQHVQTAQVSTNPDVSANKITGFQLQMQELLSCKYMQTHKIQVFSILNH